MNRISILLLTLLPALAAPAAETEDAVARCAAVDSNLDRLSCYDALARELAGPDKGSEYGKWKMQISQNPFDDTTTVLLVLRSDDGRTPAGEPVNLLLRCESRKTDAYINWGAHLGTTDTELRYRIGAEADRTEVWQISTDTQATFHRGNVRRFIESLIAAQRFVVQVVPTNTIPIRAEFDLRGLGEAIEPLQRTCNW